MFRSYFLRIFSFWGLMQKEWKFRLKFYLISKCLVLVYIFINLNFVKLGISVVGLNKFMIDCLFYLKGYFNFEVKI